VIRMYNACCMYRAYRALWLRENRGYIEHLQEHSNCINTNIITLVASDQTEWPGRNLTLIFLCYYVMYTNEAGIIDIILSILMINTIINFRFFIAQMSVKKSTLHFRTLPRLWFFIFLFSFFLFIHLLLNLYQRYRIQ
jgi:hypothetical protein